MTFGMMNYILKYTEDEYNNLIWNYNRNQMYDSKGFISIFSMY
jgi:hypothetical protein